MSLFVDGLQAAPENTPTIKWKVRRFCHLVSDTSLLELLAFGKKIGMKREWLQFSNKGVPHFDLAAAYREKAVRMGALELSPRAFREKLTGGDFLVE